MYSSVRKQSTTVTNLNKWLKQAGIAGFAFFLIKGLVWLAAAWWLVK